MANLERNYDHLLRLWTIQESMLQAYYAIFISCQSILLGFAAAVATRDEPMVTVGLLALGLFVHLLWISVCRNRALGVSFLQWRVLECEDGTPTPKPLSAFKDFQRTHQYEGQSALEVPRFKQDAQSVTRRRMETQLPAAFALLWLALAVYTLGLVSGWWL